jgi:hypothetical protein
MDIKTFLLRFLGFILIAVLGVILYAVTSNLMIMFGMMPDEVGSEGFGQHMTQLAMYLYMISIPIGIAGIFLKAEWRWALYLCPLYAPSLFAIVHTITQA